MDLSEYRRKKVGASAELEGILPNAVFNVSPTKKIVFSKGNLQFRKQGTHETAEGTKAGVWRFAESQYEYVGEGNQKVSESYTGWVDLFGWGTSGWENRDPWMTKKGEVAYYPHGNKIPINSQCDCSYGDWGVYNAISNGGNTQGLWRSLTEEEMTYLLTHNGGWTMAYVKAKLCMLLFPKSFPLNQYSINTLYTRSWNEEKDGKMKLVKYSAEQFSEMERLGGVALPCAGNRTDTSLGWIGMGGSIWSSSVNGEGRTNVLWFTAKEVYTGFSNARFYGRSVRLVHDL